MASIPTEKVLARLVEDALEDLGCDVSYDALPKEEVMYDIARQIKIVYADVEEDAWKYNELQ